MASSKRSANSIINRRITCSSADCANGLHSFRPQGKARAQKQPGGCRECGVELINWKRVHKNNPADMQYTLDAFQHEYVRHHYWQLPLDEKALNYARRKGITGLEMAVRQRLWTSIGRGGNPYDGRQTPLEGSGNPIHYAQHATATCCRKCLEYWHGIPRTIDLDEQNVEYLAALLMRYLVDRIPNLTPDGEYIPRSR